MDLERDGVAFTRTRVLSSRLGAHVLVIGLAAAAVAGHDPVHKRDDLRLAVDVAGAILRRAALVFRRQLWRVVRPVELGARA